MPLLSFLAWKSSSLPKPSGTLSAVVCAQLTVSVSSTIVQVAAALTTVPRDGALSANSKSWSTGASDSAAVPASTVKARDPSS